MTNIEKQTIALNGQEVFELFQEPFVMDADFGDIIQTMTNVPPDTVKKMQFTEVERYVTRSKEYCQFDPVGGSDFTQREVQTYYLGIDKEFCAKELQSTVWMHATNQGARRDDLNGTLIGNVMLDQTEKAYESDKKMLIWFGDRASGQPQRTAADGFWSVFIPKYVGSGDMPRTTAYANKVLGLGEGIELLEALYLQSDIALKESIESGAVVNNLRYYVERAVFDQVWADLAEKVSGSTLGKSTLMEGVQQIFWRGIPVKVAPMWGTYAHKFYSSDYTAGNNANLAILCHTQTLLHLTDTDSAEMESKFDDHSRKNRVIMRYAMGAEIIYPKLCSVAYNH